jgi:regulator of extracellular matrix RemA (YlzA/DUF370 family)
MVARDQLVALTGPQSAAAKRLLHHAQEAGRLLDLTHKRPAKAVLILADGSVLLAALTPETIANRSTLDLIDTPATSDSSSARAGLQRG